LSSLYLSKNSLLQFLCDVYLKTARSVRHALTPVLGVDSEGVSVKSHGSAISTTLVLAIPSRPPSPAGCLSSKRFRGSPYSTTQETSYMSILSKRI
jgi:hypothetical protein